jgi:hypothetical protein
MRRRIRGHDDAATSKCCRDRGVIGGVPSQAQGKQVGERIRCWHHSIRTRQADVFLGSARHSLSQIATLRCQRREDLHACVEFLPRPQCVPLWNLY